MMINSKMNNFCEYPTCDLEKVKGSNKCILHLKSEDKDVNKFLEDFDRYIDINGYDIHGVHFPDEFILTEILPDKEIRFQMCHFFKSFYIERKNIYNQFNIDHCTFHGPLSIFNCSFTEPFVFSACDFKNSARLNRSKYHNNVLFYYVNFDYGIDLSYVQFDKMFQFNNCQMGRSFFYFTNILDIEFKACSWPKDFIIAEEAYNLSAFTQFGAIGLKDSYLNNVYISIHKFLKDKLKIKKDILFNIMNRKEYSYQNNLNKKNGKPYSYANTLNDHHIAQEAYRKLRLNYNNAGEPLMAGEFYYREKVSERKQKGFFQRITTFFFNERIFGYGERPFRVFTNSIIIIIIYSIIYKYSNCLRSGELLVNDFKSSLYFSIVTFTTLGYGDYKPIEWLRFVSAIEALMGAFLIALFLVTLTKKFIR